MLIRKRPQVIPGGGGAHPLHPPPGSAPVCRTSDYPKDKVSFSPNTVEEETVTSATSVTTVTPSTSHEAIEDVQLVEEAEVEEEEEYDTDSDAEYPIADNYEVDSLDDLLFLRAVTTRSGRMVRVVHRE